MKKAGFSKKTVITWGMVILAVVVVLGIIGGVTGGGGGSRKQILQDMLVMGLNGGEFNQEVNGNGYYIGSGSSGYLISIELK